MIRTNTQPFLPTIKKNFSGTQKQAKLLRKTTLNRIHYPPIRNPKTKQNLQNILIQSCITNDQYDEIFDKEKEDEIIVNLSPGQLSSDKQIQTISSYVGKQAPIKYYKKYKMLDRNLQKRDLNRFSLDEKQFESPAISILQKAEALHILPLCMGLVKSKGDICVLNVSDYNLGDKYIMALAAGIRKAKTLEKINLSGNRMTDIALSDLAASVGQEVTVLQLSRNKITKLDTKILEMMISPLFRVQSLGIANNLLKVSSADAIFRNARYSKHLRRLDLRSNKLGLGCLDSLAELVEKSTTLQELYIGGNYLSGKNGEKIFNSLGKNKFLRVFDYSFNQLGDDGGNVVAQSISNFLQHNKTMEHLDLSFNNFTKEASEIISTGLQPNKTLYGIHFRGNYGFINARGFLVIAERIGTVLHSVDSFKMDGYSITCPRQQNAMDSHMYRDVCWICEGWFEQEFKLNLPKKEQGYFIFIHFDFEKYEPRLISISQNVKYITMVPPKKYRYFFTINNEKYLVPNAPKEIIPFTETHEYMMNNEMTIFKVSQVNHGKGKPRKVVNDWDEIIIKTLPRNNGLTIKKEKEPWSFDKSVWGKEMKLDNQELLRKCFQRDWKCSKLTSLIKVQADQDKVKDLLWDVYADIKALYRYFSSWNPVGDIWAISSNPFTEFCQQAKIINKDTPLKIIDLTFITTNSMSGANYKGNNLVPERGLIRFQFMEVLVRLADEKFKKMGLTETYADSIDLLLKQNVLPLSKGFNFQAWRAQKYFNEFNDTLIKKYRLAFSTIYKKNSKLKVRPGEKPFMCLAEFKAIFQRIGLSTVLPERQIFTAFNNAMMTQVDQLENEKFLKMTEIEFIEGVARCAACLASSYIVEAVDEVSLHHKFEWMVQQIRSICPQQVKAQMPELQRSIFGEQEEDDDE